MQCNIDEFICDTCPALSLKPKQLNQIKKWELLRENVLKSIETINLYLLGESIPYNRFFYDESSNYSNDGLRFLLKKELVQEKSDKALFDYMKSNGIVLVDCAVCPLHKLSSDSDRILAATLCLSNNTNHLLNINSRAPIITIFPLNRGFAKDSLPDIKKRVIANYQFSYLKGLKKKIEEVLNNNLNNA